MLSIFSKSIEVNADGEEEVNYESSSDEQVNIAIICHHYVYGLMYKREAHCACYVGS